MKLLEVEELQVEFRSDDRIIPAVRGISFYLERGETVGLVGESGSGKSAAALALMGLLPDSGTVTGGNIRFEGEEIVGQPIKKLQSIRGSRIAMVFQDPFTSLNPTMTLGKQIEEPLRLHQRLSREKAREESLRLLQAVRISNPERTARRYPHEISGGQRQRVMIAMAFACSPHLLIADEPTTALDVTVQAQILSLIDDLRMRVNAGVLLITHDLGVVAQNCSRGLVMYAGQIVESSPIESLFLHPKHPYTQGLLASLPPLEGPRLESLPALQGSPPDQANIPHGCPFYERCSQRIPDLCNTVLPPEITCMSGQTVRCHLYKDRP